MTPRDETIRRLRLGDLEKLMRHRYRKNGYVLTADDAGREDLYDLLLPISLGQGHERKMKNAIGLWAPWMSASEALETIDMINRTPDYLRKPNARILGERMRLTNHDREAWGIRTIAPIDMTPEQLKERRKAKDSERKWRKRRAAKKEPREAYLANSLSRLKPWARQGISRRTWERRRASVTQLPDASVSAIKLTITAEQLASRSRLRARKGRGKSRKKAA